MKPVKRSTDRRLLAAVGLGLVAFLVLSQFADDVIALVCGVAIGAAVWALTARRVRQ